MTHTFKEMLNADPATFFDPKTSVLKPNKDTRQ